MVTHAAAPTWYWTVTLWMPDVPGLETSATAVRGPVCVK